MFLLIVNSYAQQVQNYLPFQGRLTNSSGVALSGQYTFNFQIVGTSYSETFASLPVVNGLYAVVLGASTPLPTQLFQTSSSAQLQIMVNGVVLQTVSIYAPIERDPSIPANIKDGIDWTEISNIPTSIYQQLSISGNNISISNGNSITLPQNNNPNDLAVGTANAVSGLGTTNPPVNISQQSVNSVWQSFKLSQSGQLTEIKTYLGNGNGMNLRLKIYNGVGNNTQAIYNELYLSNNFSANYSQKLFAMSNAQPLNLLSDSSYTFELIAEMPANCVGCISNFTVGYNSLNPYPNGQSNINASADVFFDMTIVINQGPVLSVNNQNNGLVGIGTPNTLGYKVRIMGADENQLLLDNQGQANTTLALGYDGLLKANMNWNNPNKTLSLNTYTNNAEITFTNNSMELLRVKANGNVGIGTSSPSKKLEVNGDMSVGSITPKYTGPTSFIIPSTTVTANFVQSYTWTQNDHTYVLFSTSAAITWLQAQELARYAKGYLVTATSTAENTWIKSTILTHTSAQGYIPLGLIGVNNTSSFPYNSSSINPNDVRYITGEFAEFASNIYLSSYSNRPPSGDRFCWISTAHDTQRRYYSASSSWAGFTSVLVELSYNICP